MPFGSEGDIDVAKGAAPGDLTLSPKWVVDLEFRFRPVDAVQLAVGANNLLDEYPDRTPYGVVDGYDYGLNNAYLPYSSRSEEHTSELQSLMRISYAVFCLKKKKKQNKIHKILHNMTM